MSSLRLELPPADINTFKEMAVKQKKLHVPPQQSRVEGSTLPPSILEEAPDLPLPGQENSNEVSSSSAPKEYPPTARGTMHRMLDETVLNDEAFPEERLRAAQFLEEAGLAPPIRLSPTPKRMWSIGCSKYPEPKRLNRTTEDYNIITLEYRIFHILRCGLGMK